MQRLKITSPQGLVKIDDTLKQWNIKTVKKKNKRRKLPMYYNGMTADIDGLLGMDR